MAALSLAATTLLLSVPASAQFAKPEDAIKYRQSGLFIMGQHFTRLGAMANGKVAFDAKQAQDNADIVLQMSHRPWGGFIAGSEGGNALPVVWSNKAKFDERADQLQAATQKLDAAAKTGNLDTLKTAFGDTARACKACHDDFRKK